jgi:Protein of unknown function (DUF2750)
MGFAMSVVHLEELQCRMGFVRDVAASGAAYVVEGQEGIARVPSPRRRGLSVELMWSQRQEAERWADVLVDAPRVAVVSLETLLVRHLPKLSDERRLVGVDWSAEPAEPEFVAGELDQQLRRRLVEQLVETAAKTRQVWLLKAADAPATLVTRHPAGGEALPVFADRISAERAMDGPWGHTVPTRVPIGDFVQKIVVWCAETRRRIAPAYVPGPGLIEMPPWDMKALLSGQALARRVA